MMRTLALLGVLCVASASAETVTFNGIRLAEVQPPRPVTVEEKDARGYGNGKFQTIWQGGLYRGIQPARQVPALALTIPPKQIEVKITRYPILFGVRWWIAASDGMAVMTPARPNPYGTWIMSAPKYTVRDPQTGRLVLTKTSTVTIAP